MRRRTTQLTILFIVIYTLFFVVLALFFLAYTNNYFEGKIKRNRLQMAERTKTEINTRFDNDYEIFTEALQKYTNEELNANLSLVSDKFLYFGNLTETSITIADELYELPANSSLKTYFNEKISIYSLSLLFDDEDYEEEVLIVFRTDNRFAYTKAKSYFQTVIYDENYLITDKTGQIFLAETISSNLTNLDAYLDKSSNLVTSLNADEKGYQVIDTLDGEYLVSYLNIESAPDLFYLNLYPYQNFVKDRFIVYLVLLIGIIVSEVIFFLLSFAFSHLMTAAYRDFELSYFSFSYNVIPIIRINKSGKIIRKNNAFKKELRASRRVKTIEELIDIEMPDLLKLAPLKAWFLKEEANYSGAIVIPVKTTIFGYTLLLYPFYLSADDSLIETTIKETVEVPSLNQYKHDLDQLLTLKKAYAHSQAVAVLSISNLISFEMLRGGQFTASLINKVYQQFSDLLAKEIDVKLYLTFDNYFILLYRDSDLIDIKVDLRRIINALKKELKVFDYVVKVELKAGIYPFNYRTERASSLSIYDKAKKALTHKTIYEDVIIGVYDDQEEYTLRKLEQIRIDLEEGLKKEEFILHFQPQYHNEDANIIGFEALLRWNNPKYEKNSIEEFIEVAEESDAILRLGKLVIEKSFEALKKLSETNVTMSINISPNQLLQAGFVNYIETMIADYQIDANNLIFEITETTLIPSFSDIFEKIKLLQALGIKIHIDDFGKGNSSLLYIKELALDGLKIDKDFIADILTDKYSRAVVNMIISLAKNLEIDLVVEGVETKKQNEYLIKQGVTIIQGFLISKALPFEEAVKLLNEYNKGRPIKAKEVRKR